MTEHTKLPWQFDSGVIPPDGPGTYCDIYIDGGDTIIAQVNDQIPQGQANAAYIVKAVNAFPDLVKALEDARLQLEYVHEKHGYATTETVLVRIRDVLGRVKSPGAPDHG